MSKDLAKMTVGEREPYRQLEKSIDEAVHLNKFDEHLNKEQFNEHSRDVLMKAEIHDLFERDLIDLIAHDNTEGVELVKTRSGKTVLLIGNHCRYGAWRELYDSLVGD